MSSSNPVREPNPDVSSAPCRECGIPINQVDRWGYPSHEQGLCFTCGFWHEKLPFAEDPSSVRVEGTHYWIAPDEPQPLFRGFGGSWFTIKFHDGRVVKTNNLWCQGEIEQRFRDRLPDNAEFVYS